MKISDFPNFNRGDPPQMSEYKGYLKKYKNEDIKRRFADFNFLLFVADLLGVGTSITMAQCIANNIPHDPELVALLN